jgi:hypothetical protein
LIDLDERGEGVKRGAQVCVTVPQIASQPQIDVMACSGSLLTLGFAHRFAPPTLILRGREYDLRVFQVV